MKFSKANYEELFVMLKNFATKLIESNSHVSPMASVLLANMEKPDFKGDYWTQFSSTYKKLMTAASNYVTLDGENEEIQSDVRGMLGILRAIEPLDFVAQYKAFYLEENGDDIAKQTLQQAVAACIETLNPMYRYKDTGSNDYLAQFDLISVDGKRIIKVDAALDKNNNLEVEATGYYKDPDIEFEVSTVKFDMLQFKNIQNCVNLIMDRIALKVSMKVNGTRFRIGSYVFLLTSRDLASVRADLLRDGTAKIYSQTGECLILDRKPNSGKVVERIAQMLLTQSSQDKVYYRVDLNASSEDDKVVSEKKHTLER